MDIMKISSTNNQISNKSQHAAHSPRKRWRCGSACAAREPNSKFQTKDPSAVLTGGIISAIFAFAKRCDKAVARVLVIEY
jgi:hypothetical protein